MADLQKSTFENINDLIKSVAWPLIALLAFICFRNELTKIIRAIPTKIENSSELSLGSLLSLKIEQKAIKTGNKDLAPIIQNLSELSVRKLLSIGESNYRIVEETTFNYKNTEIHAYQLPLDIDEINQLESSGLISTNEPTNGFIKFFERLESFKDVYYISKEGKISDEKDEVFDTKQVDVKVLIGRISQKNRDRIENNRYQLTAKGKTAVDLIIKVVSESITNQ